MTAQHLQIAHEIVEEEDLATSSEQHVEFENPYAQQTNNYCEDSRSENNIITIEAAADSALEEIPSPPRGAKRDDQSDHL